MARTPGQIRRGIRPPIAARSVGVGRIALAGPSSPVAPPPPPPEGTQFTSISWQGEGLLAAIAGGLANNEISYNSGLFDLRADNDLSITTAGDTVSNWASGQSLTGVATNGTAARRPAHSTADDWVAFTSPSDTDNTDSKLLGLGALQTRYGNTNNALGVAYILFRLSALPAWQETLFRIGVNSGTYPAIERRAYRLYYGTTGSLVFNRGGTTSGDNQTLTFANILAAGAWYAAAVVFNDSRVSGVVNGAPDRISRLFLKSKPGGTAATMLSANGATAFDTVAETNCIAQLGRSIWNNNASFSGHANVLRLHSFGFDINPPITDTGIENNLDKLLARV